MYCLSFDGRVERGEGIASQLGCPTANLAIEQGAIIPALGVYVGEAKLEGTSYHALICVNDGRTGYNLKLEVHLLDQDKLELLGKHLHVVLLEKLRDLVPYPGDAQMTLIIAQDMENARSWFATSSHN